MSFGSRVGSQCNVTGVLIKRGNVDTDVDKERMVQWDGGADLQAKEWWGAPTKPRSQETDVGQVLPTAIRETKPGIFGL